MYTSHRFTHLAYGETEVQDGLELQPVSLDFTFTCEAIKIHLYFYTPFTSFFFLIIIKETYVPCSQQQKIRYYKLSKVPYVGATTITMLA